MVVVLEYCDDWILSNTINNNNLGSLDVLMTTDVASRKVQWLKDKYNIWMGG